MRKTVILSQERIARSLSLSTRVMWPLLMTINWLCLNSVNVRMSDSAVVPMALGQLSAQILRARGLSVDWHQYPMPHSVCAEEIADLRTWMAARLLG